jgi:hypothetical protein
MDGDKWFEDLARQTGDTAGSRAPSRLKARAYSALIASQQESGGLLDVSSTKNEGRKLCVFEELVQIAPVGQTVKSMYYCRVCHARVLAENFENAPIWWPHCPYAGFQNR